MKLEGAVENLKALREEVNADRCFVVLIEEALANPGMSAGERRTCIRFGVLKPRHKGCLPNTRLPKHDNLGTPFAIVDR
jgi:hypothetical protein